MTGLRLLFASAEIYPLAKTGGLADVSAALPQALREMGVDVRLCMPGYPAALEMVEHKIGGPTVDDGIGGQAQLIDARMPDSGLPIWLLRAPALFERDGDPYRDYDGVDWPDNAHRFGHASRIAAAIAAGACEWIPNIVHANDWHFGLLPALLRSTRYSTVKSIFTIHNLAFQGCFPPETRQSLGLSGLAFTPGALEFYGSVSFIKAGIRYAHRITTVSPSYSREILTPEFGCGLDGLLRTRVRELSGNLNGIDERLWNPATDPALAAQYSPRSMAGKKTCKSHLQRTLVPELDPDVPLVVFISRLTDQKMADVVADAIPELLKRRIQFASLGRGDHEIEGHLVSAVRNYPGRASVHIGCDENLSHQFCAGGDILLHPARFEPRGLSQLYALRYGAVPVVRHVGGLGDTIVDANEAAVGLGNATGFSFREPTAHSFLTGLDRALALYRVPVTWRRMQRAGMSQSFGWDAPARQYLKLYRRLVPTAKVGAVLPLSRARHPQDSRKGALVNAAKPRRESNSP